MKLKITLICLILVVSLSGCSQTDVESQFLFTLSEDGEHYIVRAGEVLGERVIIPNEYNGKPVKEIDGGGFAYNEIIKYVFIPNTIENVYGGVFYYSINLEEVEFEENSNLKIINIGMFQNTSITEITIPSSVETIGNRAFQDTPLEHIYFEEDSKLKIIRSNAFFASSLTSIIIPASVIELDGSFKGSKLASISFENSDLDLTIGNFAFSHLTGFLTEIHIPSRTIYIDDAVFYDTKNITIYLAYCNQHELFHEDWNSYMNITYGTVINPCD